MNVISPAFFVYLLSSSRLFLIILPYYICMSLSSTISELFDKVFDSVEFTSAFLFFYVLISFWGIYKLSFLTSHEGLRRPLILFLLSCKRIMSLCCSLSTLTRCSFLIRYSLVSRIFLLHTP